MAQEMNIALKNLRLIKGSITRAHTFASNPSDTTTVHELVTRITSLDNAWAKFEDWSSRMYSYEDVEGYVDPEADMAAYEEKYFTTKGKLESLKHTMGPRESTPDLNDAFSRFAEQQSSLLQRVAEVPSSSRSELPKIKIEPFTGNYKDWPAFKDLFVSAIGSKEDLSNVQKFHYLSSLLKDDAAKLIKHMQVSDTSYTAAWGRLTERFDRPRHIVTSYLETFMMLKPVKEEDAVGLRKISDVTNEVIRGLDAIKQNGRDPWLIHLINNKLDPDTRRRWIENSRDEVEPTVVMFLKFLDQRCEELELGTRKLKQSGGRQTTSTTMVAVNNSKPCYKCDSTDHILMKCPQFLSLNIDQRRSFVKITNLCFNCLSKGHSSYDCKSGNRCRTCKRKHHTLTHQSSLPSDVNRDASTNYNAMTSMPSSTNSPPVSLTAQSFSARSPSQTFNHILPTALVGVRNHQGSLVTCSVLLDTASELSYITESCMKQLGLRRQPSRIALTGISSIKAETTNGHCHIHMQSKASNGTIEAQVHVLNKITSSIPRLSVELGLLSKFENITLADPAFNRPSEVDILLGAGYVWDIFTFNKIHDQHGNTIAVSSIFGWVVTSLPITEQQTSTSSMVTSVMESRQQHVTSSLVTLADIDQAMRAFWEIEECHTKTHLDDESLIVEQQFQNSHGRHIDGRYIVELPFKEKDVQFSDTYTGALTRFYAIERRLSRNPTLKSDYTKFMREYHTLGHMRQLAPEEVNVGDKRSFYLPHHPIVGTKLRVVFDGSFQDASGISLNDKLHIGPAIQRNLFAVCLRFRLHKFVFSADIVKMFRQIWVIEGHRNFQRILWRENPDETLKHYQLCTVTYGTASAPFLSVRVLEQVAKDYAKSHPKASNIILKDFYVDDVVTGASSEEQLVIIRDELVDLLLQAGLQLSKWVSNSDLIATEDNKIPSFLEKDQDKSAKVLGIHWHSTEDVIGYRICSEVSQYATKRKVLSDVARIFDPLGLVSPAVIKFKVLFQELWLLSLGWDDPLPQNLAEMWISYRNDLHNLEKLKLPRFVPNDSNKITLHGFSDASNKAYAAVVYCRMTDENGITHTSLVASKTRVAPLKPISIPRLELCGALLLTRLMNSIITSLPHKNIRMYAWCDSTVVLSWLSVQPIKLRTFVANRTSEILDTLPRSVWKHVNTKENPADCASRGLMAEQLLNHDLWWTGPSFLRKHEHELGNDEITQLEQYEGDVQLEMKRETTTYITTNQTIVVHPLEPILEDLSTWGKFLRVTAYVKRFINLRIHKRKNPARFLTLDEIAQAKITCLKMAQNCFSVERTCLLRGKHLHNNSKLIKLSPYIDSNGLLRVGGRISNSELSYEIQHPVILPKEHKVTTLILDDEHILNLHPGVSTLFFIVRQHYWILGSRNLIRKLTHKCLKCFRQAQHMTHQRMADLPAVRVRQAFPFQNTGCDYAGPFTLKTHSGRTGKTSKGYICLFVCMVTSAIHLELATDLSTECFLAALRRFMARRGKCSTIFSDNGKNFVGAKRKLNEMYQHLQSEDHNEVVTATLAHEGIKWTFIPPYSPHWGGLWESGVRSVKLHLRRVLGSTILTYEQMHTLLAQVEAVVNSRPLGAAPDTETKYLSPSHFLIGRPTTMLPEGTLSDVKINRLDYWQNVQCMYQGFWKQWSKEYLTSLQQRPKWCNTQPNITINDIILIKEDKTPPSTWITGRVMETFPGHDGLVRVVKIKTAQGTMTRPISKIVKLPIC